jgi:hypothetical protein
LNIIAESDYRNNQCRIGEGAGVITDGVKYKRGDFPSFGSGITLTLVMDR